MITLKNFAGLEKVTFEEGELTLKEPEISI
jgi:hypothetical protein